MKCFPKQSFRSESRPDSYARREALEPLEPRTLFSSLTLMTHGFNADTSGWVDDLADRMADRQGVSIAQQPRFLVTANDPGGSGGAIAFSAVDLSSGPSAWTTDDAVVLLDWSDMAGDFAFSDVRSTGDIAAALSDWLLMPNALPGLAESAVSYPLHLVGHSRGASLVNALATSLGESGIWVDHLTTLDPHPVDGIREPFLFSFDWDDAAMGVAETVRFADNYWRSDGNSSFDFTGEENPGARNVRLSESVLSGDGSSIEHSDVWAWYLGTTFAENDLPVPMNVGGTTVNNPVAWYGGANPARDTGYNHSRHASVGFGARPIDGSGVGIAFGGTETGRSTVSETGDQWPNVAGLSITNAPLDGVFASSDWLAVDFLFGDGDSDATVTWHLASDTSLELAEVSMELAFNSYASSEIAVQSVSLPLSNVTESGTYYLIAEVQDAGGRRRVEYREEALVIESVVFDSADFNQDGAVNLLDLDILGQNWNQPGASATGDANGDGQVNLLDLDVLGQAWGSNAVFGGQAVRATATSAAFVMRSGTVATSLTMEPEEERSAMLRIDDRPGAGR